MTTPRRASIKRNTAETQIQVSINLDGTGAAKLWAIKKACVDMATPMCR